MTRNLPAYQSLGLYHGHYWKFAIGVDSNTQISLTSVITYIKEITICQLLYRDCFAFSCAMACASRWCPHGFSRKLGQKSIG
jgi:hypothetical protein